MQQSSLKILCAYFDTEPDWLGTDPEIDLEGHHITVVHTYREAKEAILDTKRGVPTFDVILADMSLPGGYPEDGDMPYCPVVLQPYLDQMLVRGFGIFVPKGRESMFESSDGYSVLVASQECWNQLNKRDWQKLLEFVIKASSESDQFNVRYPEV